MSGESRTCPTCHGSFVARRWNQRYCTVECRERRPDQAGRPGRWRSKRLSSSARGYGTEHQRRRRAWAPKVAAGGVACARCGRPIVPGSEWHLDHSDDRGGYLGPSHKRCNLAAATAKRVALARARQDAQPARARRRRRPVELRW